MSGSDQFAETRRVLIAAGVIPDAPDWEPQPSSTPLEIAEGLGIYWLIGTDFFFFREPGDGGKESYYRLSPRFLNLELRRLGYRHARDKEKGESLSQIEQIIAMARRTQKVDWAGSLAGYAPGVREIPGIGRAIITKGPDLITSCPGSTENIDAFLDELLGTQKCYFLSRLALDYRWLLAGHIRPGQAQIFVGPPDAGKGFLQGHIITPVLGGRQTSPKAYLFGEEKMNDDVFGCEHLAVEEVPASVKYSERELFGERMKEVVKAERKRLRAHYTSGLTVAPFWRLTVSVNFERLRQLPPFTEDLTEALMVFSVHRTVNFWKRFGDGEGAYSTALQAIRDEMPAFCYQLLNHEIPPEMRGRRYGVRSFMAPEVAEAVFENEPAYLLLQLFDAALFGPDSEHPAGQPWTGKAADLFNLLFDHASPLRRAAERGPINFNNIPSLLGDLSRQKPDRVKSAGRTAKARAGWIINPPPAE